MKKTLQYIFLIAVSFFIPTSVLAATDTSVHGPANDGIYIGVSNSTNAKIGVRYTPTQNQVICSVSFAVGRRNNPTDGLAVKLTTGGTNPDSGSTLLNWSNTVMGSQMPTGYQTLVAFNFTNCTSMVAGTPYDFVLQRTGSLDLTNNYELGQALTTNYPFPTIPTNFQKIVYSNGWSLISDPVPVTGGPTTADIINFISTPTSTCDFQYWPVNASLSSATRASVGENWSVGVMAGLSGFPLVIQDYLSGNAWDATLPMRKVSPLPAGQAYQAYAFICSSANRDDCDMSQTSNRTLHLVSSTPIWDFIVPSATDAVCVTSTVDAGGQVQSVSQLFPGFNWVYNTSTNGPYTTGTINVNGATTTSNAPAIDCSFNCGGLGLTDSVVCGLKEGICNTGLFLFYPNQSALNNFTNLKSQIEKKPPFGYFSIYSNALNGISSATSTTSTINATNTTTTGVINKLAGLSFIQDLQTILEVFLWLSFLIYIFFRFKNFEPNI